MSTTDTRSALEIAVAALKEDAQRRCDWGVHCVGNHEVCRGCKAREALAAMRAAPGLADDDALFDVVFHAVGESRNSPERARNSDIAIDVLKAIDAYQSKEAGLK